MPRALHDLPERRIQTAERQMVEELGIAGEIVGHIIVERIGVDRRSDSAAYYHMEHIEDRQSHEEGLKSGQPIKNNHGGGTQNGIGHSAQEDENSEGAEIKISSHRLIEDHDIGGKQKEADGDETELIETQTVHPKQGDDATNDHAESAPLIIADSLNLAIAHALLIEHLLEYALCSQESLSHSYNSESHDNPLALENGGSDERVWRSESTSHGRYERERAGDDKRLNGGRVEPVERMAIAETSGELKQPSEPKGAAEPVDSAERHIGHEVDTTRESENGHKHDHENASHEEVHIFPPPGISNVGRQEIAHLHGTEDEDVKDREKDREIAFGRDPELDDTHALESTLNFAETRQDAESPEARQIGSQRREELADHEAGRSEKEQQLVAEMELEPEEQREIDSHASQVAIEAHQNILAQQLAAADNLGDGPHIESARHLEKKGEDYIDPGADGLRDASAEHWHPVELHWWHGLTRSL